MSADFEQSLYALLKEVAELRELRNAAIAGLNISPCGNQTVAATERLKSFTQFPMGFHHEGRNYSLYGNSGAINAAMDILNADRDSIKTRHTIITKLTSKGLNELALEIGAKHIAKMELNEGGFDIQLDREFLEALL